MKLELEFQGTVPDNWIPIESIAVIKCLDQNGEVSLCIRGTTGVTPWEAVGMFEAGSDAARKTLAQMFEEGRPD